ncbi:MAG: ribonuclease R [Bacilli bacterium]|nr:ribonuclease R [Bacilli bacterium]
MQELKEKIIEYFSKPDYVPLTHEALAKIFNNELLDKALEELEQEYLIRKTKKGHYDLLSKNNIGVGIIDIKEKGFGFIKELYTDKIYFVDKVDKNGSFSGDTVLFAKYKYKDYGDYDKPEAKVLDILKRGITQVIGQVYSKKRGKLNFKANIAGLLYEVTDFGNAKEKDLAILKIDKYSSSNLVYGHIEKVIGKVDDKDALYKELAFKYGFNYEFSSDVLEEASNLSFGEDDRLLIDKVIFTIDGDDAKDFDDAVSCEMLDNGNYLLGVYIADVASYVKENSKTNLEAYDRGTSVYLPNKVIPMLPEKLSNDLCSLNEKTKKKVIACLMEIDNSGNVVSYDIKKAYIISKHRMTYNNVNKIIKGDKDLINEYIDIKDDILLMNKLKDILKAKRVKRGSLDFTSNEIKIVYEADDIKEITVRERDEAECLIEEFMLIANETVASHFYHLDLPFIYRVHEEPSIASYKKLVNLLKGLGVDIYANYHHINNFDIQKVLKLTEDNPPLQNLVLRLMPKAKYSEVNIGHFGLASPIYTHFTSPIRRYPDLVVHRLIHKFIFEGDVTHQSLKDASSIVSKASINSSRKERDAISFEYEATDRVVAGFYEGLVGYEFTGRITSVTSYGLFVTLDNLVEGMVHISRLPGYYVYDEATSSLIETSFKHKRYTLGQKVKVVVNAANGSTGQIDFIIVK